MNFNLHFGELHSDNSINDKNNLFQKYIPKCYIVKRILISLNCFSEYILAIRRKLEFVFRMNHVFKKFDVENLKNLFLIHGLL